MKTFIAALAALALATPALAGPKSNPTGVAASQSSSATVLSVIASSEGGRPALSSRGGLGGALSSFYRSAGAPTDPAGGEQEAIGGGLDAPFVNLQNTATN